MRSSHFLWSQEELKGWEGLAAKGRKVSGSQQGKRAEVMSSSLTPVTRGTVTASLLHSALCIALGSLLGLPSAIGYQYIIAGGGGAAAGCSAPLLLSVQGSVLAPLSLVSQSAQHPGCDSGVGTWWALCPWTLLQAGNGKLPGAGKNSLAGFYHFKRNKFQLIALVRACMVLALLA